MKAIFYSFIFFFTPLLSMAGGLAAGDTQGGQVGGYIGTIIDFINDILFPLALAIAFIFLIWGIVKHFVIGADSDDGKSKGKQLIIYSLVGFVVIFSFYGLINIIQNGLGFTDREIDVERPEAPGIRS